MRRLEELQTLTEDERQMLREVKEAVLRHAPGAELILYGSTARGERQPDSDYDLLVLLEEMPRTGQEDLIRSAIYSIGLRDDRLISVVLATRAEWQSGLISVSPYHAHVEQEGASV